MRTFQQLARGLAGCDKFPEYPTKSLHHFVKADIFAFAFV